MFLVGYLISLIHLYFIMILSLLVRIHVLMYYCCIDLFICTAARVSNKFTYLLTLLPASVEGR